jgi:hypothetical protein
MLDKKVVVLRGSVVETLLRLRDTVPAGSRMCDILHLLDVGAHASRSGQYLGDVIDAASAADGRDLVRVVYVGDFDLSSRVDDFPPVLVGGRMFVPHNTTAEAFAPPSTGANPGGAVRWQLGAVWLNESVMGAIANWDGVTGRTYGTTLRPHNTDEGVPFMRQVWLGEAGQTAATGERSCFSGGSQQDDVCERDGSRTPSLSVALPDITVVISYTIRVFGETALGLRAALRLLGYSRVVILPDVTLSALRLLRAAGSGSVADVQEGLVIQIALGPHDFTMLLPHFIAFQVEQVRFALSLGYARAPL